MGNCKNSLGNRMKGYEYISRNYLTRRIPVIIRVDGKAFHTFTKGLEKPFDRVLMSAMQDTMKYLCENIQGCVFGYTQSDEITLVLTDYATIATDAWFGYNVQKMTSIVASMATLAFNNAWLKELVNICTADVDTKRMNILYNKIGCALFDARAFSLPKNEVCNCLIWRQQDATRNSIEAVGQANFSHTQLHGKGCDDIQEMLWSQKNINWNDFPVDCKRGSCCYRVEQERYMQDPKHSNALVLIKRKAWVVDREPPIFTQDRNYIERWL